MAALTITAANVRAGSGAQIERSYTAASAASIAAGATVYLDTSSSPPGWRNADADSAASATYELGGIALHAASGLQPLAVLVAGDLNSGATVAVGTIYVVGSTAGSINPASDLVSGWYPQIVGIATTTSNIHVIRQSTLIPIP